MTKSIRVLIVDDSLLIQQILSRILSNAPDIEVVGVAADPFEARDKIKLLKPDVLTLDIEMPRMDGITFLKNLMRLHPLPVVMISTLTHKGADITLEALSLGAVDFLTKPSNQNGAGLEQYAHLIIDKVRAAAQVNLSAIELLQGRQLSAPPLIDKRRHTFAKTRKLIAIGASTGGTEAIFEVLKGLRAECPAIVIAQHIPEVFSTRYAERLNRSLAFEVHEPVNNEVLLPGSVYLAPGNAHFRVVYQQGQYQARISQDEPVNRHRPSVDVLFHSVEQAAQRHALGIILTGMGKDGAVGLKALRDAGAHTIAQDQSSSVVWGMPGAAVALNAAALVLSLGHIAQQVHQWIDEALPHKA